MVKRLISAVVGVPVLLFLVFIGGPYYIGAIMLIALIAAVEIGRILKRMGINDMQSFLYAGALLFPLLLSFEPSWLPHFFVFFIFSGVMISLSRYPESDFLDLGANFLSLLYVAFGFAHFILLRQMEQGMLLVGFAFSVIWMTDIGSFFVGTYLGKRPLFKEASPNKTIEGAIGGLVCGIAGGLVYCVMINRSQVGPIDNMGFLIILTPFLCVAGILGDLFESALKRRAKVKDASQLIPGHGGILDRFDSALWIIPLLYHALATRMTIFS